MKKTLWILSLVFWTLLTVKADATSVGKSKAFDSIDPKSAPEYVLYISAQKKFLKGDLEASRKNYLKSLKANRIFFPSMIGLAEIEDSLGNKQEAENHFKKAFGVAKNSALLHTSYGKFLFKYNDVSGAKNEFEKALKINPKQPDAHTELAVIYLSRLNNRQKAIEHYQMAINESPNNIKLLYGLSAAQSASGNVDMAISTLKIVVGKLPEKALPWQYMGVYYARAGRFNKAITALKTSIKHDPKRIETRWILGESYVQAKQFDNALREYQWLISNSPQKDVAYLKRGLVYQIRGDFPNAEIAYLKSRKANPKLADAYNNLAYLTLETKKDYKKGLQWAKTAVRLKPRNSIFLDTLGWLYYQMGDYKNAKKQLHKAIENKPASAEVNYHLGKVYEQLNNKSAAAQYFAQARKIDEDFNPTN